MYPVLILQIPLGDLFLNVLVPQPQCQIKPPQTSQINRPTFVKPKDPFLSHNVFRKLHNPFPFQHRFLLHQSSPQHIKRRPCKPKHQKQHKQPRQHQATKILPTTTTTHHLPINIADIAAPKLAITCTGVESSMSNSFNNISLLW